MRFTLVPRFVMLRIAAIIVLALVIIVLLAFALLTDDPIYSGKPYDEE